MKTSFNVNICVATRSLRASGDVVGHPHIDLHVAESNNKVWSGSGPSSSGVSLHLTDCPGKVASGLKLLSEARGINSVSSSRRTEQLLQGQCPWARSPDADDSMMTQNSDRCGVGASANRGGVGAQYPGLELSLHVRALCKPRPQEERCLSGLLWGPHPAPAKRRTRRTTS